MAFALPHGDIAGATVAIVKDGKIVLTKGYGYADVQKRVPVDADRHLFRVASISKLFTWTAVMQQVERGRIDLDADVNGYLDFRIPPYRGKPLTMRHLMTHTAGFELVMRDLFRAKPDHVALGDRLKAWVPERLYPPGTTPTYSNYATALGGYIVERVSGERFENYIERHILNPLGMARTTFRQPLPPQLARDLSRGYLLGSGSPFPFEYTAHGPAGGLTSSAPDMARFMIAHLDNGQFGTSRILMESSAKSMHATRYAMLPPLHGIGLGFYQHDTNGHRVVMHDGDTRFFHSQLNLFLDDRVGIFVSLNSAGRDGAMDAVRSALFTQFAERYFPSADAGSGRAGIDPPLAAEHARAMAGYYIASDRSASNFLAINSFRHPMVVEVNDEGGLSIPALTGVDGAPKRWREVSPFLWHEVGGHDRLAAQLIEGKPVRFGNDEYAPLVVWDRQPWWRPTAWLQPLSQLAFAILALSLVVTPILAVARWRNRNMSWPPKRYWAATAMLWLAALAGITVPSLWITTIDPIMTFTADNQATDRLITTNALITHFAYLGGLLSVLWICWLTWSKSEWAGQIWDVALATSFALCGCIAWGYNLLSFRTNF